MKAARADKELEALADKMFQHCVFDPQYMDEAFVRECFKKALIALDDEEYLYIKKKMEEI